MAYKSHLSVMFTSGTMGFLVAQRELSKQITHRSNPEETEVDTETLQGSKDRGPMLS